MNRQLALWTLAFACIPAAPAAAQGGSAGPPGDCDGDGIPDSAELPPVAIDHTVAVSISTTVQVNVAVGATSTNGPIDADSVQITSNPIQGSIPPPSGGVFLNGVVTFQHSGFIPPTGCGPSIDQFSYTIRDACGGVSAPATVYLQVQHPNPDCNCNFIPDASDLLSGEWVDNDGNGVPDACQTPPGPCRTSLVDFGSPWFGNQHAYPDITPDGRFVAFQSRSGFTSNINVHDRLMGTTELASVRTNGSPSGNARDPRISDDGRFVVFSSTDTSLVTGDTNGFEDVFVRDLLLDTTRRISVTATYGQSNGHSYAPAISGDGRWVAFETRAQNIHQTAVTGRIEVCLFDLAAVPPAVPVLKVSRHATGNGNGDSHAPSISQDGRYVAFETYATNLVAGESDTNNNSDILRFDRLAPPPGFHIRISRSFSGGQSNSWSYQSAISADGGVVAFLSDATNLAVGADNNGTTDAFAHDVLTQVTVRASKGPFGEANNFSSLVRLDPEGRRVLFVTAADNLTAPGVDNNFYTDVFVHDLTNGETTLWSVGGLGFVGASGSGDLGADLSAGGAHVCFQSDSPNLAASTSPNDSHVYLRTCSATSYPSVCAGDGSGTPCPCGNNGAPGQGCGSSVNPSGARLATTGTASLTWDDLALDATGLTPAFHCMFLQGTSLAGSGAGTAFGDGLRCGSGTVIRLGFVQTSAGTATYPPSGALPVSLRGGVPHELGVVRFYQVWYRNSADFCTPDVFNLTNAVRVTWQL